MFKRLIARDVGAQRGPEVVEEHAAVAMTGVIETIDAMPGTDVDSLLFTHHIEQNRPSP